MTRVLQFICVCLYVSLVSCQNDETCKTKGGSCIAIKQCPSLLELVKLSKLHPENKEYYKATLKQARCGSEGRLPKVCCPSSTDSPARAPAITSRFAEVNSDIGPVDKLYSFPEPPVCGTSKLTLGSDDGRVVGGKPAKLSEIRWMALLGYNISGATRWNCGGFLISSNHVVTAAHCMHNQDDELYVVRLGELDYDRDDEGADPVDVLIKHKIKHEKYDPKTYRNDIGILVLMSKITFTDHITPICLPTPAELINDTFVYVNPLVAGWGKLGESMPATSHLRVVQLPVVSNIECDEVYSGYTQSIDDSVLCAGHKMGGKDACGGDSGGPLMITHEDRNSNSQYFYVIGLVSFAKGCAAPGFYGVYTRVTHFIPWLKKKLLLAPSLPPSPTTPRPRTFLNRSKSVPTITQNK